MHLGDLRSVPTDSGLGRVSKQGYIRLRVWLGLAFGIACKVSQIVAVSVSRKRTRYSQGIGRFQRGLPQLVSNLSGTRNVCRRGRNWKFSEKYTWGGGSGLIAGAQSVTKGLIPFFWQIQRSEGYPQPQPRSRFRGSRGSKLMPDLAATMHPS